MPAEPIRRIVLSPRSVTDLSDIHARIARTNPLNAGRFIKRLRDQLDSFIGMTGHFAGAPESRHFAEPLFHVTVWPYRIVYRVKADVVEIVTIRHGARRPLKPDAGRQKPSGGSSSTP